MFEPALVLALRFGPYEADLRSAELRKNGQKIKIQEQPFQVLAMLLAQPGQMVTREELRKKLWATDTFVDFEHGLNTAIRKVREALEDSAVTPHFIETLARRGYRFVAPVKRAPACASEAEIRSIAVLPLENLSGDQAQEYFADALTEELVTNLGKAGTLRVISRTSVMHYKGSKKALPEIARELNVDAVVEGTVRRQGNRVRVTANLIHAATDCHLWAEAYEHDLKNMLAAQSDVTSAIAGDIRQKLTPEGERRVVAPSPHPVNPEAYDAYLRGRYYAQRLTREGVQKSSEFFGRAIQVDSLYAPAYAALADSYVQASLNLGRQRENICAQGRECARRALALDPGLAEAHAAVAGVAFRFDWDWALAENEFEHALLLNPNLATVRESYGEFLMRMGRCDESIAEYKRAQSLDPLSLLVNTELGWGYGFAGRHEESIAQFQEVLELDANFAIARFSLGVGYELVGRHDGAIGELTLALAVDKDNWVFLAYLGYVYGRANQQRDALEVLAQLQERAKDEHVSPFGFAMVHLGLCQHDKALTFFEEAYQQHDPWLITLKASHELDPLRSEPRFQNLLRQMNFPP